MMVIRAIQALRPNVSFSITGDDLSTLVWLNAGIISPTQEEVAIKIAELEALDAQAELDRISARTAVEQKLSALGLTLEDIAALKGVLNA